ncbi:MAG TPA: tetratricopeptide repeat protein [Bacteroidetes bacterium]|nr:tetratricopeptide repeat protein [Bacteroidota bacterium]
MIFGHRSFCSLICGILLIVWTIPSAENASAGESDPVLATAGALSAAGNFDAAITEYLRYLYFHPTAETIGGVYLNMGNVYLRLSDWENARDAFRRSIRFAPNDSLKNVRRLNLAIHSIAHKNYSLAVLELLKVASFSKQPHLRRKAGFYLGVANVYLLEFDQVEAALAPYFSKDSSDYGRKTWQRLQRLAGKGKTIHPRSPATAKWLSTVFPGLGQLYSGDFKNAVNALALNGLLGYGVTRAFLEQNYVDAVLEGVFLFQRYYMGNRVHAAQIARTRPIKKEKKIAEEILTELGKYLAHKR